nr:LPS assembly lipoprotein LptE [uncultured Acetobacter sp.]
MSKPRFTQTLLNGSLAALLLGAPLALGGCGFQPLYGERADEPQINAELKRVYVSNIPERLGQQVRLALQQNMAGDGPEEPDGYKLSVQPSVSSESLDIHSDNTSGRVRMNGHAHWWLYSVEQYPKMLAQGDATALDGYTATYEQYFAQTMNNETATGRVAKALADQITQQVATWLRTQSAPAQKRTQGPKAFYPMPNAIPNSEKDAPMEQEGDDAIPDMATGRGAPSSTGGL